MVKFDIMDEDNSLNIRYWGYYEPTTVKGNLGLQLMSPTMPEKPFLGARNNLIITSVNGGFHQRDIGVSQPMFPMEYTWDVWIGKLLNMLPGNHNYAEVLPETTSTHHVQMFQPPESANDEMLDKVEEASVEEVLPETTSTHHVQMFQPPESANDEMLDKVEEASVEEKENGPKKKRQRAKAPNPPEAKKGMRAPRAPKPEDSPSVQQVRSAKKAAEIMINWIDMDMSVIPIPVCSCTGNPQQCYRWDVVGGNQHVVRHAYLCIPCLSVQKGVVQG